MSVEHKHILRATCRWDHSPGVPLLARIRAPGNVIQARPQNDARTCNIAEGVHVVIVR